jgi:hypothetical protein
LYKGNPAKEKRIRFKAKKLPQKSGEFDHSLLFKLHSPSKKIIQFSHSEPEQKINYFLCVVSAAILAAESSLSFLASAEESIASFFAVAEESIRSFVASTEESTLLSVEEPLLQATNEPNANTTNNFFILTGLIDFLLINPEFISIY